MLFSGCAINTSSVSNNDKDTSFEGRATGLSVESSKNPADNQPIKILFVGDLMFDRYIREAVSKYGHGDYNYIFEPLKEKLAEYDLVVGNLEGPITDKSTVSVGTKMGEGKNFKFTFDPIVAKVLAENNIKLVNLGNNHILNQGEDGVTQTKNYLDQAGVKYFDDNESHLEIGFPSKIYFVNYNYSVSGSAEEAIEKIKSAKEQGDFVIVCPHWGTEYKIGEPGKGVRALARLFVDAGADVIIGTHPHVIQSSELYKEKKVYYSLGNFIFDQYFQKETMEGLGVEVEINPETKGMNFQELKFQMDKKGQTRVKS
jgi:poly-gamma-glutamate capsule biosynthesis protein CapA/YwtB (metallophosphatase superfamily)